MNRQFGEPRQELFSSRAISTIFFRVKPSESYRNALERFSSMGLRGNPFRVLPVEQTAGFYAPIDAGSRVTPETIAESSSTFVQIVGQMGFGKSALLAAVQSHVEEAGSLCDRRYLAIDHDGTFEEPIEEVEVFFLDEAQRLHRKGRRAARLWRDAESGRRLIVTTHEDLRKSMGDDALTVELPRADAKLIEEVFRRRIAFSGGDPDAITLTPQAARWLATRSKGALRWVEKVLYEVFQGVEVAKKIEIDEKLLRKLPQK